ncbi:conserved hypothetical protein [Cupriavidus necator]|uniref:DNA-binding protein n=2 Tax=Cupriavidus necator TaxID=106590 RepID=A0A1K0JLX8_CUPNE|nr:conserved hypothetical protein [Cupriavidus necator]
MTMDKTIPIPTPVTQPFWEGCTAGEFRYQLCNACHEPQFYPRALCRHCHAQDLSWKVASGFGTVHTYTTVHRAPSEAFDADVPYLLALIDLDEGIRIMTNILNATETDVSVGAKVRIVFESRGDRVLPQAVLAQ